MQRQTDDNGVQRHKLNWSNTKMVSHLKLDIYASYFPKISYISL